MATITSYAKKFHTLNIEAELPKIIEQVAPEMIAYNQQQMYRSSIDSLGNPLGMYKSAPYALRKYEQNPLPGLGRPDLNLTGTLYRGMYLKVTGRSFYLGSYDAKEGKVEKKYGKDIWGLTRESKTKLAKNDVRPLLMGYIRNVLRS
jgi:hypothetical protein